MLLHFGALNMRNVEQKTAIYLAAENSHHECLEMLATAGALTSLTLRRNLYVQEAVLRPSEEWLV